jgi:hypothetical protein
MDSPNVLPYSRTETPRHRPPLRLGIPVVLWLLQFVWIAAGIINTFNWHRKVHGVVDSLYFLLIATPSIAGLLVTYRIGIYHFQKTKQIGPLIVCLLIFSSTVIVTGWVIYLWISVVLLDPKGSWIPIGRWDYAAVLHVRKTRRLPDPHPAFSLDGRGRIVLLTRRFAVRFGANVYQSRIANNRARITAKSIGSVVSAFTSL